MDALVVQALKRFTVPSPIRRTATSLAGSTYAASEARTTTVRHLRSAPIAPLWEIGSYGALISLPVMAGRAAAAGAHGSGGAGLPQARVPLADLVHAHDRCHEVLYGGPVFEINP